MQTGKIFLEVLNKRKTQRVPFWFMRQAGRYLPEYRELRSKSGGFLKMVYDPKIACEITMQPIRRFGMDAAIIFSDILVIPQALGQKLEFVEGEGPQLEAIKNSNDLMKLNFRNFEAQLSPVYEALRQTRSALKTGGYGETALIGFCGAPWTLAAYMIEGGGSDDFAKAKEFAKNDPKAFSDLIATLVESNILYLSKQVEAGAEALQIFDSHAGILDGESFKKWVIEPTKKIVAGVKQRYPNVPIIGFPRNARENYISYAKETGISAMGLDQHVDTKWTAQNVQNILPVQGNLDPEKLLAGGEMMMDAAKKILADLSSHPFVFNLGHGVIKETPPENVEKLCLFLKDYKIS